MIYKMELTFGHFDDVATQAKSIATTPDFKGRCVEFDFNGIACRVNKNTDLTLLFRDYQNALLMNWMQIGPNCIPQYPADLQGLIKQRIQERDDRHLQEEKKWEAENRARRDKFLLLTHSIKMDIKDQAEWDSWKAKNNDEYGSAVFEYAEGWAKLMQIELAKGKSIAECAGATSHGLAFLGITGFMYGAAVSILSKCWRHGEELMIWHNKKWNYDGEGVANPAVFTLGKQA